MGLEGIVSKRLTAPYKLGPSRDWIKVKNPDSPAMIRARDHFARLGQCPHAASRRLGPWSSIRNRFGCRTRAGRPWGGSTSATTRRPPARPR
jgi:hypothetical protein